MTAFSSHRRLLAALALVALAVGSARADVIYTQKTRIKGAGEMTRMEIVKVVRLHKDQGREESTTHFSSPAANAAGTKSVKSIDIYRLDQSLIWSLDPTKKTFVERGLDEVRADRKRIAAEADTSSNCMESPDAIPVVTVNSTDQARLVGVWEARRTTITSATRVVDLGTGERRNGEVVLDLWIAQEVPGQDEMRAFASAWSNRLALAAELFPLEGVAGGYERSMQKIRAAYDKIPGCPVAWTWVVRSELSPEDRAALEPNAGASLSPTSADQELDTELGMTVILKAESVLESASDTPMDPATFEVPSDYRRASR